jgi:hypothetical protein
MVQAQIVIGEDRGVSFAALPGDGDRTPEGLDDFLVIAALLLLQRLTFILRQLPVEIFGQPLLRFLR